MPNVAGNIKKGTHQLSVGPSHSPSLLLPLPVLWPLEANSLKGPSLGQGGGWDGVGACFRMMCAPLTLRAPGGCEVEIWSPLLSHQGHRLRAESSIYLFPELPEHSNKLSGEWPRAVCLLLSLRDNGTRASSESSVRAQGFIARHLGREGCADSQG